jgi:hypothetical protein
MSNVVQEYFNNRTPEVEALYAAYRRGEVDIFGNRRDAPGYSLASSVDNPNLTDTSVIGQAPTQTTNTNTSTNTSANTQTNIEQASTPSDIMNPADVERLYQDVLDRKADPYGLEFYTGMSYEQAKKELEGSPEYLTNEYYKEKFGAPLTYEQRALFPSGMSLADRYAKIDSFATPGGDTGGTGTGGTGTGGISTLPTQFDPTGAIPIDLGLERTFRGVVGRDPRQEDYDFYLKEFGDVFDFADRADLTRRLRPEQLERFDRQLGLPSTVRRDAAGNIPTVDPLNFDSFGATPATAGIESLRPRDAAGNLISGTMASAFANPQFTSPFSIQTEQQQLPDTFTQLGSLFGEQFKEDIRGPLEEQIRAEIAEEAEGKRAGGLASLYKEGGEVGDAGLANIAQKMASYGRYGDTMLAHISPEEAMMLKAMGGSGTRNPVTGLPEFFLKKIFKSVKSILKPIYKTVKPFIPYILPMNIGVPLAAADAGFTDGKFDFKKAATAAAKVAAANKIGEAMASAPAAGTPTIPSSTVGPGGGNVVGTVAGAAGPISVPSGAGTPFAVPPAAPPAPRAGLGGFKDQTVDRLSRIGSGIKARGTEALAGDFSGFKGTFVPSTVFVGASGLEAGMKEAEKAKAKRDAIFAAEEDKKKRFRGLASRLGQDFPFGYNEGGISSLPPRYLDGMGDGMSDSIKANIGGMQEARLADGEFVVPADVVADLGNGSSNAGAERLYSMMDRIRQARHGTTKQPPEVNVNKALPA